jgi:hypothetical protein
LIDEVILKKLAERGVESTKFHGLDSVVFDKFGFSGMEIVDLNILLDLVRAKRNSAITTPAIHQDPFAVGELERLRQELNDLRRRHQDLVEKSNLRQVDPFRNAFHSGSFPFPFRSASVLVFSERNDPVPFLRNDPVPFLRNDWRNGARLTFFALGKQKKKKKKLSFNKKERSSAPKGQTFFWTIFFGRRPGKFALVPLPFRFLGAGTDRSEIQPGNRRLDP